MNEFSSHGKLFTPRCFTRYDHVHSTIREIRDRRALGTPCTPTRSLTRGLNVAQSSPSIPCTLMHQLGPLNQAWVLLLIHIINTFGPQPPISQIIPCPRTV